MHKRKDFWFWFGLILGPVLIILGLFTRWRSLFFDHIHRKSLSRVYFTDLERRLRQRHFTPRAKKKA